MKVFLDNENKHNYRFFLNETIRIIEESISNTQDELLKMILPQLHDIKINVVEQRTITDWDDIDERYTIGSLAIHNMDEKDTMRERILNIFYGAIEYNDFPE